LETVIEIINTPKFYLTLIFPWPLLQSTAEEYVGGLKQKRRGALAPRREGQNRNELSLANRRVNRETLVDKSTHAYAKQAVDSPFVSHGGRIIALNHVKSYNLNHTTMGNFAEKATLSSS
jgi:hypothetical protein